MSFLKLFSPFRLITGFIITTFVIYPALSDPTGTFTSISEFIGKLIPIIEGGA